MTKVVANHLDSSRHPATRDAEFAPCFSPRTSHQPASDRAVAPRQRADQMLEFVGLHGKRFLQAGSLSFGQQKLLEFAMALMNEPSCLLLDEPTAGINPTLINGLIDRLKRANSEFGITLFIIEHNMRVIMNMADHIYCLAHGEMLAEGSPEEIQNDQRVIDAYLGAH